MVQRKASKASEEAEELTHVPLQAILLADSFATKFRPITLERPKVLLPLVGIPMIEYSLAWLESAEVEEVFVFCCAHSKQVIKYLESSQWFKHPNMSVRTIESHNSASAGDALRFIYEQNVIHGDFVLVSGDTVSNMSLTEALREHKERRKKDNNAVMTMVVKKSKPSAITHQSRLGTDELFMAIDPDTKQLIYYWDNVNHVRGTITLEKALLTDSSAVSLHNDMQDCYIDICAPEVLSLFTDNFDYQHLRRDFVKGLLGDDIMSYKIYTHEIHQNYAAKVENFRSYDTISKDIIQRWTYPLVPDVYFFGNTATKLGRQGIYRTSDVGQSRSAEIGPSTLVGKGSTVGSNSKITNSVIGEGCKIGSNVKIEGSYIWDNVTIEDGCKLMHAIICDGVVMKSGAVLEPGVILDFKVVIGEQFVVPAYSKVSLYEQPTVEDSDEELEYADSGIGMGENSSLVFFAVPVLYSFIFLCSLLLHLFVFNVLCEVQKHANGYLILPQNCTSNHMYFSHFQFEKKKKKLFTNAVLSAAVSTSAGISDGELVSKAAEASEVGAGGAGRIWSVFEGGREEEWKHSVAPISEEKLAEISQVADDDIDQPYIEDGPLPQVSTKNLEDLDTDEPADDYFEKEVEATFQRAVHEKISVANVILEVNSLKLSYNMDAADCASAIFYSMMKLASEMPHNSTSKLQQNVAEVAKEWLKLIKYYLPDKDEEIEVILKLEEMCLESATEFAPIFSWILHLLYSLDILQEEAILSWESEKAEADEADKVFLKQSKAFIEWLKNASEEESEEEE